MKNVLTLTVANLGLYNAGVYKAKTLELPMDFEELGNILDSLVVGNNEELEIFDWEIAEEYTGLIEVSPYAQIVKLNELCEELIELEEYDIELLGAIARTRETDFEGAKKIMDDTFYFRVNFDSNLPEEGDVGFDYIEQIYGDVTQLSEADKNSYFEEERFKEENDEIDIEMFEELGFECIELENYFDFESFGRDLLFEYRIDTITSIVVSIR